MIYARRLAAVTLGILMLLTLYIGVWLPYVKGRQVIFSYRMFGVARDPQTLLTAPQRFSVIEEAYVPAFLSWAPWGEDELVKVATDSFFDLIQGLDKRSAPAALKLANIVEGINRPLLLRGKGSGFMQALSRLAVFEHAVWYLTGDMAFARTSEEHFRRCLLESPRRPQCLYGLFNLLRQEGRTSEALAVGKEILGYWPSDEQVLRLVGGLEANKH